MHALGSSGDWDGLIVMITGVTWEGNRLGAQHIAERLTRYAPVLYVDPPRTPMSVRRKPWLRESAGEPPLRVIGERLARFTPLVNPLKTRPGGRVLAEALMRRQVAGAVRRLGGRVHAVVVIPPHFSMLGILGEDVTVHLASDDFVAGARLNGVSPRWVSRQERRLADAADVVVAVSPVLEQRWRALGHDPVLITNGCDVDLFARVDDVDPAPDVRLRGPMAGFMGTLSERTDTAWLQAVADRGVPLLLVGPRSHTAPHAALNRILAMPNVQWVGRQPQHLLPSYLAHVGVGLVPYTPDDFNRASFPLKMLDYLAAGLPVVASDLPSVRWLDTDLVTIAPDATSFADSVAAALAAPRDESLVRARRDLVAGHSWDTRVAQLADLLGVGGAGRSPAGQTAPR